MTLLISFNRRARSGSYDIQYGHPVQEKGCLIVACHVMFPTYPNHSLSSVHGQALLRAIQDSVLFIETQANVTIQDIYIGYEDAIGIAEGNDNEEEAWEMYIGIGVGGLFLICPIALYLK